MGLNRLERARVRAQFERAAPDYDRCAEVHREVGERLREHLEPVRIDPRVILDLGAGTGRCAAALAKRYPRAWVLAADPVHGMLHAARARRRWLSRRTQFVRADAERLALRDGCVDLVYSNLALHWCDLGAAVRELSRVSAPGALLAVSTFGPDTLRELREAWASVDRQVHVHALPDMHDVGDELVRAGFAGVVMESERIEVSYRDLATLRRDLHGQGASNVAAERPRGLTGRRRGAAFAAALHERFGAGAPLRITYEVVYAHAWRATRADPSVPVADLIRRRRG